MKKILIFTLLSFVLSATALAQTAITNIYNHDSSSLATATSVESITVTPTPGALPELPGFPEEEEEDCPRSEPYICPDGSCAGTNDCNLEPVSDGDPDQPIIIGNLPNAEPTGIEHEDIGIQAQSEDEENNESDLDFLKRLENDSEVAAKKVREIVVVGSKIKKTTEEMILKGKKILENYQPAEPIINEDGLSDYAQGIATIDENIKKITIDEKKVKVEYKHPVRLFGLFNIDMTVTAEIDQENRVKVKFPWYRFLTRNVVGNLQSNIKGEIQEMNKADLANGMADDGDEPSGASHDDDRQEPSEGEEQAMNKADLADKLANSVKLQQQQLQIISEAMRSLHDTAMAVIRKIGG